MAMAPRALWALALAAAILGGSEAVHAPSDPKPRLKTQKEAGPSLEQVFDRMQYWDHSPPKKSKAVEFSGYLFFDPDNGPYNHKRITWEMASIAAKATGRTLVLPPATKWEPFDTKKDMFSKIEDFVDMGRLKMQLNVMTFEQFMAKEETELEMRLFDEKVPAYKLLVPRVGNTMRVTQEMMYNQWVNFGLTGGLDRVDKAGGENPMCNLTNYEFAGRFAHAPKVAGQPGIFECSEWEKLGKPKFVSGNGTFEERFHAGWANKMLRDSLVPHPRFFDIASHVVHRFGLFNFIAVHAQYNDVHKDKGEQIADFMDKAFNKKKQVSLLQDSDAQLTQRAYARGQDLAERLSSLVPKGMKLYIATDETNKAFLEAFHKRGMMALRWTELMKRKDYVLKDAMSRYDEAELKKWSGSVEEIICAYSMIFVGTKHDAFSGFVNRMRRYNGAPHQTRLFHTVPMTPEVENQVGKELDDWTKAGGWEAFSRQTDAPSLTVAQHSASPI